MNLIHNTNLVLISFETIKLKNVYSQVLESCISLNSKMDKGSEKADKAVASLDEAMLLSGKQTIHKEQLNI